MKFVSLKHSVSRNSLERNYLPRFFRLQLDLVTYIIINDENIKKTSQNARDALKYLSLQATSAPKLNDEQQQSNIEEFLNHQEENAFTHNLQTKICCKKYCLTNNVNHTNAFTFFRDIVKFEFKIIYPQILVKMN
ncbi:hypothetical protein RhiirB3_436087 [Rhizophagus irregularis]|nr:hypothetical protein RhiirB3_436087 [Rhizophagus irregularis]